VILDPANTTPKDLATEALSECRAFGQGQTPTGSDINAALTRLQWMLQEWERDTFMVYHKVTYVVTTTGAQTYTVGPGGQFNVGAPGATVRPDRILAGFLRQLIQGQPVDYPLELVQSMEDYSRYALKQLTSFTGAIFYDASWPLGTLYPLPIPQANIYALGIVVLEQLPQNFALTPTIAFNLPYEYYYCMLTNLAMRLRPRYGLGTYPGDTLPQEALKSKATLKGAALQIPRLQMPKELIRPGIYNIFSDRSY
jgi:hypothetical protein